MSKRRRTSSGQPHSIASTVGPLGVAGIRYIEFRHFKSRRMGDSNMSESVSTGTQTGTAHARQGANEVGHGLEVTVPRAIPHLYNNNYTVRLTYADSFNRVVSNAGGGDHYAFRTNSIYDPDYTSAGHQPLMRDLWASQYDYYTVLACHYHIELYNCAVDTLTFTAAGTFAQRVGAITANLLPTTNITDISNAGGGYPFPSSEMKNAQTKVIWPENWVTFEGTLTPGDFIVDAKHLVTNRLRRNTIDAIHTHIPFGRFPRAVFLARYVGLGCIVDLVVLGVCAHGRQLNNERFLTLSTTHWMLVDVSGRIPQLQHSHVLAVREEHWRQCHCSTCR